MGDESQTLTKSQEPEGPHPPHKGRTENSLPLTKAKPEEIQLVCLSPGTGKGKEKGKICLLRELVARTRPLTQTGGLHYELNSHPRTPQAHEWAVPHTSQRWSEGWAISNICSCLRSS